ncbi:MAG: FtsX-like permease family protein, partial [Holophagales bacterium]|nr:FtsX-like permease family protein [Holophagales bacterium]
GESALGQRMKVIASGDEDPWLTIAGVVADMKPGNLARDAPPQTYVPYTLPSFLFPHMSYVVETELPLASIAPALRSAVWEVDPAQPISSVATLEEQIRSSFVRPRFYLVLLGGFAAVALILALAGIYATITYSITERRRELCIRMALGAGGREIRRHVLRQGLLPVAIGLAAGLVAATGLSRFLEKMLFTIEPTDPATYLTVACLLAAVAFAACLGPSQRAARTDPAESLRAE